MYSGCTITNFYFPVFAEFTIFFSDKGSDPLSDLIFSGVPYNLKLLDENCVTLFVSEVLQIFTIGHLLNLSTALAFVLLREQFCYVIFP